MSHLGRKVDEMLNEHLQIENSGSINWNDYIVGKNLNTEEYGILMESKDFLISKKLIVQHGSLMHTKVTQEGKNWKGYAKYEAMQADEATAKRWKIFQEKNWPWLAGFSFISGLIGFTLGLYNDSLSTYIKKKYPLVDTTYVKKKTTDTLNMK